MPLVLRVAPPPFGLVVELFVGRQSLAMERKILGYHQDDEGHWVAELECGHTQHVRHNPPWTNRPWVTTPEGRQKALGTPLNCRKCDAEP
jgi:hypothetical protein